MDEAEKVLCEISRRASSATPVHDILSVHLWKARHAIATVSWPLRQLEKITCSPDFFERLCAEHDQRFRISIVAGAYLFEGVPLMQLARQTEPFIIHQQSLE